jgi:hypothetical protein
MTWANCALLLPPMGTSVRLAPRIGMTSSPDRVTTAN